MPKEMDICPQQVKDNRPMDGWPQLRLYPRMGDESFRDQVLRRLKETGMSVAELARTSGVSKGAIYKLTQRAGASTSAEKAHAIAKVLDLDVPTASTISEDEVAGAPSVISTDVTLIPVYDVRASAGPGLIPADYAPITNQVAFALDYIRRVLGLDPSRVGLITVSGDSMKPTLENGDLVLLDFGADSFDVAGIYVFRHDDAIHIKRVMRSSRSGSILAIPDNDRYREQEYPIAEIALIGRVVWSGGLM